MIGRKLAILILLSASFVAFATLGDGKKAAESKRPFKSLLSTKTSIPAGFFSLKSGYNFKGNQVFQLQSTEYINLNSVATFQLGKSTYILPLKKKVLLDKVTFNPNVNTRR